MTVYPNVEDKDKCTMKFRAHKKQFSFAVLFHCRFRIFSRAHVNDAEFDWGTKVINNYEVSGFTSISSPGHRHKGIQNSFHGLHRSKSHVGVLRPHHDRAARDLINFGHWGTDAAAYARTGYDKASHCTNCKEPFSVIKGDTTQNAPKLTTLRPKLKIFWGGGIKYFCEQGEPMLAIYRGTRRLNRNLFVSNPIFCVLLVCSSQTLYDESFYLRL